MSKNPESVQQFFEGIQDQLAQYNEELENRRHFLASFLQGDHLAQLDQLQSKSAQHLISSEATINLAELYDTLLVGEDVSKKIKANFKRLEEPVRELVALGLNKGDSANLAAALEIVAQAKSIADEKALETASQALQNLDDKKYTIWADIIDLKLAQTRSTQHQMQHLHKIIVEFTKDSKVALTPTKLAAWLTVFWILGTVVDESILKKEKGWAESLQTLQAKAQAIHGKTFDKNRFFADTDQVLLPGSLLPQKESSPIRKFAPYILAGLALLVGSIALFLPFNSDTSLSEEDSSKIANLEASSVANGDSLEDINSSIEGQKIALGDVRLTMDPLVASQADTSITPVDAEALEVIIQNVVDGELKDLDVQGVVDSRATVYANNNADLTAAAVEQIDGIRVISSLAPIFESPSRDSKVMINVLANEVVQPSKARKDNINVFTSAVGDTFYQVEYQAGIATSPTTGWMHISHLNLDDIAKFRELVVTLTYTPIAKQTDMPTDTPTNTPNATKTPQPTKTIAITTTRTSTKTSTPTRTPTTAKTYTPTNTATKTNTPIPTKTFTPTPTPTPEIQYIVRLGGGPNLRKGPSTTTEIIRAGSSGEEFIILGYTPDGSDVWWYIQVDETQKGWVSSTVSLTYQSIAEGEGANVTNILTLEELKELVPELDAEGNPFEETTATAEATQ